MTETHINEIVENGDINIVLGLLKEEGNCLRYFLEGKCGVYNKNGDKIMTVSIEVFRTLLKNNQLQHISNNQKGVLADTGYMGYMVYIINKNK